MMNPFFVYGTLLPGQPNFYLWGKAIVQMETAVFPNGRLYDMGHYPMMIEQRGEQVKGRLITVQPADYTAVLACLDSLEGYNPQQQTASAYRRLERIVALEDGRSVMAWIYLGQPRYVTGMPPILSGDWAAHMSAKRQQISKWWATIDSVAGLHNVKDNEQ